MVLGASILDSFHAVGHGLQYAQKRRVTQCKHPNGLRKLLYNDSIHRHSRDRSALFHKRIPICAIDNLQADG